MRIDANAICLCKPGTKPLYKDLGPSVLHMVLSVPNNPLYLADPATTISP